MSRIRSKNTKPEMIVRRYLFSQGFRFRLHDKKLPGKPDIKLTKYKTVIFINGCFWHGHEGCKYFVIPENNREYWISKILRNKERDKENIKMLKMQGWKRITVYECELKTEERVSTLLKIKNELLKNGGI